MTDSNTTVTTAERIMALHNESEEIKRDIWELIKQLCIRIKELEAELEALS